MSSTNFYKKFNQILEFSLLFNLLDIPINHYFWIDLSDSKLIVTECAIKAKSEQKDYKVLSTERGIHLIPSKKCNYEFILIFSGQNLSEHPSESSTLPFGCLKDSKA